MNIKNDATVAIGRELTRIVAVKGRLLRLRKDLADCTLPNAANAKSKLLEELCDGYESLALPRGEFGRVSFNVGSDQEAGLCESIDDLLDQLACTSHVSRLWQVKASIIFDQVEALASHQETQLGSLLRAQRRLASADSRQIFSFLGWASSNQMAA